MITTYRPKTADELKENSVYYDINSSEGIRLKYIGRVYGMIYFLELFSRRYIRCKRNEIASVLSNLNIPYDNRIVSFTESNIFYMKNFENTGDMQQEENKQLRDF